MNWESIGAAGEIIGALAVVATLFYLSIQIRQNTLSVRASSFQAGVDSINAINTLVAGSQENARLLRLGMEDPKTLSDDDLFQFNMLCLSLFRVYENLHYQSEKGVGMELWAAIGQDLPTMLSQQGVQSWWSTNPYAFTPAFTQLVESSLPE